MADNMFSAEQRCINLNEDQAANHQQQMNRMDAGSVNQRVENLPSPGYSGALRGWSVRHNDDNDLLPEEHDVELAAAVSLRHGSGDASVTDSEASDPDISLDDEPLAGHSTPSYHGSPPRLISSPDISIEVEDDYLPDNMENALADPYEGVLTSEVRDIRPNFTHEELWVNTYLGSNIEDFQVAHMKFRRACVQMLLLDTRIREVRLRIRRAVSSNNRPFSVTLEQHISVWIGVKMMFFEYATRLADKLDGLDLEISRLRARLREIRS